VVATYSGPSDQQSKEGWEDLPRAVSSIYVHSEGLVWSEIDRTKEGAVSQRP
jgi:hypothetical protein